MKTINIEEIKIKVDSDTKGLDKDLEKVKKQLKDIDKLVKNVEKTMNGLSKAFKNINTTAFARSMKEASSSLNTATKSADSLNKTLSSSNTNINRANQSAKSLANTLGSIGDVEVSVSQGAGSSAIGAGLAGGVAGGALAGASIASAMAPAITQTQKIKQASQQLKVSFASTIEMMSSMPYAIKVAVTETEGLKNKIKAVGFAIKETAKQSGFSRTIKDMNRYVSEVTKAKAKQRELSKEMDKTANAAGRLSGKMKALIASFAGLGAIRGLFKSIQADMSSKEAENLFAVSFGEYTEEMRSFTNNAINDFAMTQTKAMEVAGSFNFMLANITKNKEQAKEMSKELLQMTTDFSSLFNVSIERSQELIRGALTGEAEGLKQFGIIVNDATMKQYAYANGIAATGAELNESQKLLARYGTFMEQAGIANGDFAKTVNSPANQLRILQAQLERTRELIGQAFRPITTLVLPILNALVSGINKCIQAFGLFMSAFFGVEMTITSSKGPASAARTFSGIADNAEGAAGSMSRLGKEVSDTVKEFKGLMGFDEINLLPSTSTGGGGTGSGGGSGSGGGIGGADGIDVPTIEWGQTEEVVVEIPKHIQDLADKMKAIASSIFQPFKDAWEAVGPKLMDEIKKAVESTGEIFKAFGDLAKSVWDSGLSTAVQNLAEAFLNILVIGGRLYNETLAPLIEAFITWLDPATNWGTAALIEAIEWLTEKVKELTEYLAGDGFTYVQLFAEVLLSIAGAIAIVQGALLIWQGVLLVYNGIQWLCTYGATALGLALLSINWPVVLAIAAIAALIFIGIQLWKNWDVVKEKLLAVWEGIKKAFAFGKEMVMTYINAIIEYGKSWINSFKDVYNNIKNIFSNIISFIKNVFTGNWKGAWENVKNIVANVFDGIKNVAKAPINAIISAVNTMIRGLNKIKLPDWVPGLGGKGINIPEIPRLAKGGIVNSGQIYMAGEAGKEAIVPLEHNTAWAKNIGGIVAKELGGMNQAKGSDRPVEVVLQVGTTKLGRVVIDSINKLQNQEGRILLNL